MLLTTQHICGSTGLAQKVTLANSSKPLRLVRSCCVESNFCSVRLAQYFSTRLPASGFIGASGNSEWCNMTGNEDNVGFLATGSGVRQFQFSLGGCFVLKGAPHNTLAKLPYGMNRAGGGNVGMARGLFATMPERANTTGRHWSKPVAAPLHSTTPVLIQFCARFRPGYI